MLSARFHLIIPEKCRFLNANPFEAGIKATLLRLTARLLPDPNAISNLRRVID